MAAAGFNVSRKSEAHLRAYHTTHSSMLAGYHHLVKYLKDAGLDTMFPEAKKLLAAPSSKGRAQPTAALPPGAAPQHGASGGAKWIAVYDHEANDAGEVSFKEGDHLIDVVAVEEHEGWCRGTVERTGESGLLLSNYIAEVAGPEAAVGAPAPGGPEPKGPEPKRRRVMTPHCGTCAVDLFHVSDGGWERGRAYGPIVQGYAHLKRWCPKQHLESLPSVPGNLNSGQAHTSEELEELAELARTMDQCDPKVPPKARPHAIRKYEIRMKTARSRTANKG